jgi:hypothetical protein
MCCSNAYVAEPSARHWETDSLEYAINFLPEIVICPTLEMPDNHFCLHYWALNTPRRYWKTLTWVFEVSNPKPWL